MPIKLKKRKLTHTISSKNVAPESLLYSSFGIDCRKTARLIESINVINVLAFFYSCHVLTFFLFSHFF